MYITNVVPTYEFESNLKDCDDIEIEKSDVNFKGDHYRVMEQCGKERSLEPFKKAVSKGYTKKQMRFFSIVEKELLDCSFKEVNGIIALVNEDGFCNCVCTITHSNFLNTIVRLAYYFSQNIRIHLPLQGMSLTLDTKYSDLKPLGFQAFICFNSLGAHVPVEYIRKYTSKYTSKNKEEMSGTELTLPLEDHPILSPIQYFSFNPRAFNVPLFKENEIDTTANVLEKVDSFVHAPYLYNLAKRKDLVGAINCISLSTRLKAKGVVFHCGKGNDLNCFKENITILCASAIESCPVILETPAGQGTEMLSRFSEFVSFCKDIPELRVCIDTCHVFASGYNPYDYILKALFYLQDRVILVHFNDSLMPKASRKDRHAPPGKGCIGTEILYKVFILCTKYNIPMIVE